MACSAKKPPGNDIVRRAGHMTAESAQPRKCFNVTQTKTFPLVERMGSGDKTRNATTERKMTGLRLGTLEQGTK